MFKFTILFVVLVAGCLMLLNDVEAGLKNRERTRGRTKTQNRFIYPNHGPNPPAPPNNAPNSYLKKKGEKAIEELAHGVIREVGSQVVVGIADAIRAPSCSDGSCSEQPAAVPPVNSQQPPVHPAQMMNSQ